MVTQLCEKTFLGWISGAENRMEHSYLSATEKKKKLKVCRYTAKCTHLEKKKNSGWLTCYHSKELYNLFPQTDKSKDLIFMHRVTCMHKYNFRQILLMFTWLLLLYTWTQAHHTYICQHTLYIHTLWKICSVILICASLCCLLIAWPLPASELWLRSIQVCIPAPAFIPAWLTIWNFQ